MIAKKVELILKLPIALASRGAPFPEAYWAYEQHKIRRRHGSISCYILSNNKLYWDRFAPLYDNLHKNIYEPHEYFLDRLSELRPSSVLEVGCGAGRMLRHIRHKFGRELKLCGVDISVNMLEEAGKRCGNEDTTFIMGSAASLPFKDTRFDVIFTSGVLMYLTRADIESAISEFERSLTAGGHVILLESPQGIWEEPDGSGELLGFCRDALIRRSFSIINEKKFDNFKQDFIMARKA